MANQPSRGPLSGSPTLNEIANASSATHDPNPIQHHTMKNIGAEYSASASIIPWKQVFPQQPFAPSLPT